MSPDSSEIPPAASRWPRTAVVVGNPKPHSRTLAAAFHVARELTGPSRTSSWTW